jgi:nitric oxide reductase subunit B
MSRIAYRFLLSALALLVLYALVALVAAVKFLPGDQTQTSLPYQQVSALAAALRDLAILGGLLGGGIYALAGGETADIPLLPWALRVWYALIALTLLAGILNLLAAWILPLTVAQAAVIVLVLVAVVPRVRGWTAVPLVWTVGLTLSAVCALVGQFSTDNFVLTSAVRALASGLNASVACLLASVALAYWLMLRFSTITPESADASLLTVAGLLALTGALVTVGSLNLDLGALRGMGAVIVPLLCLIFAAHSYRAFTLRSASNTLAAHWTALGILLMLLGEGLLGAVMLAARDWIAGTRLTDAQSWLTALAALAFILGVCNQAAAELRGENRRVTGLAPFWLVAFGAVGVGLALAAAGLVQVYLERILGVGYLDTQALLEPLYGLWIGGLGLFALGAALYALIFWLRRPRA